MVSEKAQKLVDQAMQDAGAIYDYPTPESPLFVYIDKLERVRQSAWTVIDFFGVGNDVPKEFYTYLYNALKGVDEET